MTYPLIGNYGRLIDDDQSAHPWLRALVVANATAAVLEDARQLAALLRDAGIPAIAGVDTRALARHLRANGCLRGIVTAPGAGGRGDRQVRRPRGPALGGPGLRQPGVAGGDHRLRRRERGRPARRHRRPWAQVEHRPVDAPARRPRPRLPAHRERCPTSCRPTSTGVILSPGPGDPARLETQVALARAIIDDGRPLLGICLGHQIVGRAAGAETTAPAVRAPRGEPPGPGPGARARPGHRPEPRGPGRRRLAAGGVGVPRQPDQPQRPVGRGAATPRAPIETVQYHPEGAPGPLDALAVFDRFVAAARGERA